MRRLLVLAALTTLTTLSARSGAEVIRCADGAGNVSYTDHPCPAGAREVGRVDVPDAPVPTPMPMPSPAPDVDAGRAAARAPASTALPAPAPQRAQAPAAAPLPQVPAGPAVIDGRAASNPPPAESSRWSLRGDDPAVIDDGSGYGYGFPGGYRQPNGPRDMRPQLRSCDGAGCRDTMGNHYDRSGQVDRYRSLNGKTCQPVGTTTICR